MSVRSAVPPQASTAPMAGSAPQEVKSAAASLKILHVLDHSIPLHSGYTFRTLSILRKQRRLGWDTLQLTTPKHGPGAVPAETVEGMTFYRTPSTQYPGHGFAGADEPDRGPVS